MKIITWVPATPVPTNEDIISEDMNESNFIFIEKFKTIHIIDLQRISRQIIQQPQATQALQADTYKTKRTSRRFGILSIVCYSNIFNKSNTRKSFLKVRFIMTAAQKNCKYMSTEWIK